MSRQPGSSTRQEQEPGVEAGTSAKLTPLIMAPSLSTRGGGLRHFQPQMFASFLFSGDKGEFLEWGGSHWW